MSITPSMVKELREKTGAGIMDCKKALEESNGDIDLAIEKLREKGLKDLSRRQFRTATEGLVCSYIHAGSKIGVLLELNCETDFVARTEEFVQLAKDLAMQIAATNPNYISRQEVPSEIIEKEKSILKAQALTEGKPERVIDKIVAGRLEKFFSQVCLLEQPFIKDGDRTIEQLVAEKGSKVGENIVIRRFMRYLLGETSK